LRGRGSREDQGPGVPANERERIFERFVRLGTLPSEERGSGLGLAICRSIIELHRGRIWAEEATSGPGLKILFEIPATELLPVGPAEQSAATEEPTTSDIA
jgi:two-component system heavy metal sensor histidine kinase CusS